MIEDVGKTSLITFFLSLLIYTPLLVPVFFFYNCSVGYKTDDRKVLSILDMTLLIE